MRTGRLMPEKINRGASRGEAPSGECGRNKATGPNPPRVVQAIGHSTRTLREFIGLRQIHEATCVAAGLTLPRSRHNPPFNLTFLPGALKKAGLNSAHQPGLGGLRHAKPDSRKIGRRNASFRGYPDSMQTPKIAAGLGELIRRAIRPRVALMGAEALPWRCHRSPLADALLGRGIRTEVIMSATRCPEHALTAFAKVQGTTITYPAAAVPKPPARPSRRQPVGPRPKMQVKV